MSQYYPPAHLLRGNAYCRKGDYDQAIKDYDETIRRNPENADYNSEF